MPLRWQVLTNGVRYLARLPELNVLAFGFLLHLPWELWLSGAVMGAEAHLATSGELPLALSSAAVAHAAIGVAAFWFVAAFARSRGWIRTSGLDAIGIFVLASLLFTLIAESLVMGLLSRLEHPGFLPTFAAPGLGLPSLLQGIVSSSLIILLVRRQLGSRPQDRSA